MPDKDDKIEDAKSLARKYREAALSDEGMAEPVIRPLPALKGLPDLPEAISTPQVKLEKK